MKHTMDFLRGQRHFLRGEYRRSIMEFGGALESGMDAASIHMPLGLAYFKNANFSEAAAEARVARQQAELSALRDAVAEKISELNLRTAILKQWVERREALLNAAGDELVKIYGTLEPDVAAQQIVRLDVRVATSILRKLKPAAAGAILNAMEPKRAALLAKVISSAGAGP